METPETLYYEIPVSENAAKVLEHLNEGKLVFDYEVLTPISIGGPETKLRGFVPWGDDNLRPNAVVDLRRKDEVMSSNIFFNILAGYGAGLTLKNPTDPKGKVTNKEVLDFFKYNRPVKYLLEQQTDLKHFFFTVSVIILNGDGSKIVKLCHKDSIYCRFETCNPKNGNIEHVYYANWQLGTPAIENIEVIELLDPMDPLGDLEVRMGRLPNDDGQLQDATTERKFALVNMIPIPGQKYYPFPYSWAVFNSGWYDIKQSIAEAKKQDLKNGLILKWNVIIDEQYWITLFEAEKITDPEKRKARMILEKENFKNYLSGTGNASKTMYTGKKTMPDGRSVQYVEFQLLNPQKEGGHYLQDTEEASNMECYADSIHPNLIGATPGKSGSSMSGSDKRELFTIKQALEVPLRQILLEPYFVISNYNGWENYVEFDIPFMQLTTLDQGTSAKPVTADPTQQPPQTK